MKTIPLLALAVLAACGAERSAHRTVQPGSPGEATVEAGRAGARPAASHTQADAAFLQAMIPHHAQALVMTALVPGRTERRDILLLAERIEASQEAEIGQMRRWLEARGEAVPPSTPDGHAAHHEGATADGAIHGMASAEELARLEASRNGAFDRLFLELMIRHHEGALRMTRDLLATEGAGREPELFQLISHIDADQRAEIARMRRMLEAPIERGTP